MPTIPVRSWRIACYLLLLALAVPCATAAEVAELRGRWSSLLKTIPRDVSYDDYPYADCFATSAERYRIPVPVLLGLAWGESAFDPRARSPKNALGLMQILWPGTAGELGFDTVESVFDPCRNIAAGARYLRHLMDRVDDDLVLALASYNHGPGAIAGDDRNLNRHAKWYVRYIYDKTLRVVLGDHPQGGSGNLLLGRFTDYDMARGSLRRYRLLAWFRDRVDLRLEVQRGPSGEYELSVLCEGGTSRSTEHARYRRLTGFEPG